MELATGKNLSSNDTITIARLASASGVSILLKLNSPDIKMRIATSFAGIMFILEDLKSPQILSQLIYAAEGGSVQVVNATALSRRVWKITVIDTLGNQNEEILKLPTRLFVPRSNFKYLSSFPKLIFNDFSILQLEGNEYETT